MKMMGQVMAWWRRRFSQHSVSAPGLEVQPSPVAIVQEKRTYTPAKPAAGWTGEIQQHNQRVDLEWEAEKRRRFDDLDAGRRPHPPGVARLVAGGKSLQEALWAVVDYEMWKESRTVDVTGLQPLHDVLSENDSDDAKEAASLHRAVNRLEWDRARRTLRPSEAEILVAANGSAERAAQLRAKVDQIFGTEGV